MDKSKIAPEIYGYMVCDLPPPMMLILDQMRIFAPVCFWNKFWNAELLLKMDKSKIFIKWGWIWSMVFEE